MSILTCDLDIISHPIKYSEIEWMAISTSPGIDALKNLAENAHHSNPNLLKINYCFLGMSTYDPEELIAGAPYAAMGLVGIDEQGYMQLTPWTFWSPAVFERKAKYRVEATEMVIPEIEGHEKNTLDNVTQTDIFNELIKNFLSAQSDMIGQKLWDIGVRTYSPALLGVGAAIQHGPEIYSLLQDILGNIFAPQKALQNRGTKAHKSGDKLLWRLVNETGMSEITYKINFSQKIEIELERKQKYEAWCESMRRGFGIGDTFVNGQLNQFRAVLTGLNTAYKFWGLKMDPEVEDLADAFEFGTNEDVLQHFLNNPILKSIIDVTCHKLHEQADRRIENIINNTTNVNVDLTAFGDRYLVDRIGMPLVIDGEQTRANIVEREKVLISETFGGHEWSDD